MLKELLEDLIENETKERIRLLSCDKEKAKEYAIDFVFGTACSMLGKSIANELKRIYKED